MPSIYYTPLFLIALVASKQAGAMDLSALTTARDYTRTAQALIDHMITHNGTVNMQVALSDDTLKNTVSYFQKYPGLLGMLQECIEDKPSWRTKLARYITALPEHVIHEARGVYAGMALSITLICALHALYPDLCCSLMPDGITAAATAISLGVAAGTAYSYMRLPTSFKDACSRKLFSLVLYAAPVIKYFATAAHELPAPKQVCVKPEALDAYNALVSSLTPAQIALLPHKQVLLLALIYPAELLQHTLFLDSLSQAQSMQAYTFFSHTLLERFNSTLGTALEKLPESATCQVRPDKLLLACYNPNLLFLPSNCAVLTHLPEYISNNP